jgi:hypothetical protein
MVVLLAAWRQSLDADGVERWSRAVPLNVLSRT